MVNLLLFMTWVTYAPILALEILLYSVALTMSLGEETLLVRKIRRLNYYIGWPFTTLIGKLLATKKHG